MKEKQEVIEHTKKVIEEILNNFDEKIALEFNQNLIKLAHKAKKKQMDLQVKLKTLAQLLEQKPTPTLEQLMRETELEADIIKKAIQNKINN